jgi:adenylyl- and sulfurtransferase ThiI
MMEIEVIHRPSEPTIKSKRAEERFCAWLRKIAREELKKIEQELKRRDLRSKTVVS